MQLIGPGVAMYDPASGEAGAKGAREERKIGVEEVRAYFGVRLKKSSMFRRWQAIRPTMCQAHAALGSRPPHSSSVITAISTHCSLAPMKSNSRNARSPDRSRERGAHPRLETACLACPRRAARSAARRSSPSAARWKDARCLFQGDGIYHHHQARRRGLCDRRRLDRTRSSLAGRAGWRGRNGEEQGEDLEKAGGNAGGGEPETRHAQAKCPLWRALAKTEHRQRPGQLAAARAIQARAEKFDTKSYETF